jgi:hypothetical protein
VTKQAFLPFQRVAAILSDVYTCAVQEGKPREIVEALAAAMNLAIRFSLPGESRVPKHEALAIAVILEACEAMGFDSRSTEQAAQYLRGVVDA